MKVPFFSLVKQYKTIRTEIDRAVLRVLLHGVFTLGKEVIAFEKEFASYIGVANAVGVASGTDALTLALRALNLSQVDEVIVPANAYPMVFGVGMAGVRVRLIDCTEEGIMNLSLLPHVVTKKTKAIIPVHLYGIPVNIPALQHTIEDLGRHDIAIIEDCAQAHGAELEAGSEKSEVRKKKVGSFGVIGCFSFYPTKNLGAYGDAGMVVTNSNSIADRVRQLRMYGEIKRYESYEMSGISRLDELQAAILRVKLRHLDAWNRKRKKIAFEYLKGLKGLQNITIMTESSHSCFHLFVIRSKKRDALRLFLARKGIGTAIHYPTPIHLTPSYRFLGYSKGDFPVAERLSREALSLPLYPEIPEKHITYIIKTIRSL